MATPPPGEVTRILQAWGMGDQAAVARLTPLVSGELRRLAQHCLRRERPDHTLQPTALVHEAYLRLVDQRGVSWQNRAHFFGVAAQAMRRILVDYARRHRAGKRGGGSLKISLADVAVAAQEGAGDLATLDDALKRLAAMDPPQGQNLGLRLFVGLQMDATTGPLCIPVA